MLGEKLTKYVSDLARPFTLYVTSSASAYAIAIIAHGGRDLNAGAVYAGALLFGVGALYWGKAWENQKVSGHNAEVEKERAKQSPPPEKALEPAAPPPETMADGPKVAAEDFRLPPSERVMP